MLAVQSNVMFGASLAVASNVTIAGNLNVLGMTSTLDLQQVTAESNMIIINYGLGSNITPPAGMISGITVQRGADPSYQFVFSEATDTFRIGLSNSLQAVCTRADSLTTGYAYYSVTSNELVNKSITTDDVSTLSNGLLTTYLSGVQVQSVYSSNTSQWASNALGDAVQASEALSNLVTSNLTTSNLISTTFNTETIAVACNITVGGVLTIGGSPFFDDTWASNQAAAIAPLATGSGPLGATLFSSNVATFPGVLRVGGAIGVGVSNPSYAVDVNGTIRATTDLVVSSDARLKTGLSNITDALAKVNALTGYTYTRVGGAPGNRGAGLLAQDVQAVLPEAVQTGLDGYMSLGYGDLAGLFVEAIKQLSGQINAMREP
jgi:hypothetical protein